MFSENLELLKEYHILVEMASIKVSISLIILQVISKYQNDEQFFTDETVKNKLKDILNRININLFMHTYTSHSNTDEWDSTTPENIRKYADYYDSGMHYIQKNDSKLLQNLDEINLKKDDFVFILEVFRSMFNL